MERLIQIKLRESGPTVYYNVLNFNCKAGDYVVVETERGIEYGQVVSDLETVISGKADETIRKIVRLANAGDLKQIEENKSMIKEAFNTCLKKIKEHNLNMKLVEAEYSFDRSKIIFYFTAEGRIDFRDLVKDLARIFKARIELRQIGVRDEAKLFGGFGSCGRHLCCAKFLKDFEPVTIRMAKEQGLPLNPPKISGVCGRLMCCLAYEFESYKELSKGLPKEGDKINTPEGPGKVISINILKRTVIVEIGSEGKHLEINYK